MTDKLNLRQFYVFMITGIVISILGLIDQAFGNNISVDSICVLSAYSTIMLFCYSSCNIGVYTYRITQKH